TGHQFITDGSGGASEPTPPSTPSPTEPAPGSGPGQDSPTGPDQEAPRPRECPMSLAFEGGAPRCPDYVINETSVTSEETYYTTVRETVWRKHSLTLCVETEFGCTIRSIQFSTPDEVERQVPHTVKKAVVEGTATNNLNGD